MIKRLVIRNYALIESLDLSFSGGLSIITGETGAGKSIMLGAISLLLGQRADSQSLLNKEIKCVVEGEFDIKKYPVEYFFKENELDYSEVTTIRREINQDGKSRAFINDTPVNLTQLKELGSLLTDIHSQHETLVLNNNTFQLSVVDTYSKNSELIAGYQEKYFKYKSLQKNLEKLKDQEKQSRLDLDYFQFQFNELEAAKLEETNQELLEQELEMLRHSEEIKASLLKSQGLLSEGDFNITSQLSELTSVLNSLNKFYPNSILLSERIKSCYLELKDIGNEIENDEQKIAFDPVKVEELKAKLDFLYGLQQKHRVNTVEELIKIKDDLSEKLSNINSLEEEIIRTEQIISGLEKELYSQAETISSRRLDAIPLIETEIKDLLTEVAMPHAVLKVQNQKSTELSLTGIDNISFMFSANKGFEYKEISKVASGGEMSRLMLCIKYILAKLTSLPTIIFDEIDTGVSGEVAQKVGGLIAQMSHKHQLIVITHLPQMASRGESHYYVYKENSGARTTTNIRKLDKQERVVEIAKMLSGENPTTAAIENAKELLIS